MPFITLYKYPLIFRQFPHFFEIDPSNLHLFSFQNIAGNEWDHTKERDLVYACTAQAFPTLPILQEDTAERVLIEEKVMRLIIYYGNTTDACNICANAKKNAKGWRTSTDAHQACANVGPRNFPLKTRYDDDY